MVKMGAEESRCQEESVDAAGKQRIKICVLYERGIQRVGGDD